jgi:hypothetical protein
MKNIYRGAGLLLLTFGISCVPSLAQTTCNTDITLASQAEVDAFPGRGCSTVIGNFTINGADITYLDSLSTLTSVDGRVLITGNTALTSLHGLENLTSVGVWSVSTESLIISDNPVLAGLEGLGAITEIPGTLRLQNNDALTDLRGLEAVTQVGPGRNVWLDISGNDALQSMAGLTALQLVTSDYMTTVQIANNPSLDGIDGLSALTEVEGGFSALVDIYQNSSLQHVDSLSSLLRIDAANPALRIRNNPALTRGCGIYPLLAGNGVDACVEPEIECGEITLTNNGPGFTRENIIAGGQCPGTMQSQPANLVFTNVTGTKMKISFTAASPAPVSYLVLLRANQSAYPGRQPVDGTSYSVGQVLGSSTIVVGVGNRTSFNISSMSPGTNYYFNVYSVYEGNDYVNANPLTASQATENASQPTNIAFTNVATTTMNLSFTQPSPAPSGYITLMRPNNYPPDLPVDGQSYSVGNVLPNYSIVVGTGSATTLNLMSMDPDTEYYFATFSYTSTSGGNNYVTNNPLKGHQRTAPASASRMITVQVPYPNPFTTTLSIPVSVTEHGRSVIVSIFDLQGQPIAQLKKEFEPGEHEVSWDGTTFNGSLTNSGTYVYRVMVDGEGVLQGRIKKE